MSCEPGTSPQEAATVYVVDDDAAMRRSIAFLADSVGWRVQSFDNATAFLAARPTAPGCVVLDIRMPTMSGLELQTAMRARAVHLPIIFVTGHADVSVAVQAMKHGAWEFLEKPFHDQALLDAIAGAVRRSCADAAARDAQSDTASRFAQLTPREREVAARVARGEANRAISEALSISAKTVQVHRQHVLEKMGAHSAAELAAVLLPLLARRGPPGRPDPGAD
ncbi:MAG TPA: response regulator [Burkholderiaceae bacterium]|nr:response regulator [Burkholderiaceae bacterium]HRZ02120.1 response regulator [Burkholderiaceae bacterium]